MDVDIHALVGPYALDAIDDAERRQFERHIATCDRCWAELTALSGTASHVISTRPTVTP